MYPSEVLSSRPSPGFQIGVARGLVKDLHNAYSIIVLLSNCSSEKEEHCPPPCVRYCLYAIKGSLNFDLI